jgi:signal transduction histidine kinase/ActR/RegA family two-component response regulator
MANMVPSMPWFALAGATTLINSAVFGFLSWRERSAALRFWACGWLAWAIAVVPLLLLERSAPETVWALACGLLWVVSALFFLRGTYELSGRGMPRVWYGVAAGCAALAFALDISPKGGLGMLPLVLFQSAGLLATGVLMLRGAPNRAGAWLCGGALIALALHLLDAPLLAETPELMPWGFVIATALEILTALGMLMLYYEHARAQLLDAQRILAETRRVEALGRVAGGVAHDFNNMLMVMQGYTDFIRMDIDQPERIEASLNAIEQATQQAARLTAQLLAFGRRAVLQPRTIDIREVVTDTLQLLRKLIPENIEVRLRCDEASYAASMDRALLEQILLNLVTNARDAISGPGHILVELERLEEPETSVLLRVADDGSGMEEAVLNKLFEPFFTTKGVGRGTGLGLASVQGAISQLGGRIRVESRVGQGSTFEVQLPLVAAEARGAPGSGPAISGSFDILVVDDADSVREVTARMLQSAGHRVQQAKDGAQALQMILSNGYDLVLSDVVMPQMGGRQLLEAVTRLRPETLVVLTSGYPEGSDAHGDSVHFLPKPFQRNTLLRLIERLVAEQRSGRGAGAAESVDLRGAS